MTMCVSVCWILERVGRTEMSKNASDKRLTVSNETKIIDPREITNVSDSGKNASLKNGFIRQKVPFNK